jgi:hypothetical protein
MDAAGVPSARVLRARLHSDLLALMKHLNGGVFVDGVHVHDAVAQRMARALLQQVELLQHMCQDPTEQPACAAAEQSELPSASSVPSDAAAADHFVSPALQGRAVTRTQQTLSSSTCSASPAASVVVLHSHTHSPSCFWENVLRCAPPSAGALPYLSQSVAMQGLQANGWMVSGVSFLVVQQQDSTVKVVYPFGDERGLRNQIAAEIAGVTDHYRLERQRVPTAEELSAALFAPVNLAFAQHHAPVLQAGIIDGRVDLRDALCKCVQLQRMSMDLGKRSKQHPWVNITLRMKCVGSKPPTQTTQSALEACCPHGLVSRDSDAKGDWVVDWVLYVDDAFIAACARTAGGNFSSLFASRIPPSTPISKAEPSD